jgi:flagellar biosynthesis protein FlhG
MVNGIGREISELEHLRDSPRVICVTSGKGGVGKTNITVNLAYALTLLGKRVVILDADLGLANVDVLLGIYPKFNMEDVLLGGKSISDIMVRGPGGIMIIPASSGIQELVQLSDQQKMQLLTDIDLLGDSVDILLVDAASGISSNVVYFATSSDEIVVVSSPEPTSITDVYALMKMLYVKHSAKRFLLLVNGASSNEEARGVFFNLNIVAEKFLDIFIEYLGYIPDDANLPRAVRQQKAVVQVYPRSRASLSFMALAEKISELPVPQLPSGNIRFFWKQILRRAYGATIKTGQ